MGNSTTWYYLLSTIAQTLAGILGFGAVFFTLRLGNIVKEINDYKGRALNILGVIKNHIATYELDLDSSAEDVSMSLRNIIKDWGEKYSANSRIDPDIKELAGQYEPMKKLSALEFIKNTAGNLDQHIRAKKTETGLVIGPGYVASVTIIATLVCLNLSENITEVDGMRWLIASLAVISLMSIILNSWKILKNL